MNGRQILIVDSSHRSMQSLNIALNAEGYEVLTAVDGASAVTSVRRDRPDLLLLNISFPPDVGNGGGVSWDGFLILDWLRRTERADGIPVIFMTDDNPAQHERQAAAAGALGLFGKPIDLAALVSVIRRALPQPLLVG